MNYFFEMKNNGKKNFDWNLAVRLAIILSSWVVFPVIIGFFLGSYLDKKYNSSSYKFLLITLGISFCISIIGLTRDVLRESKKIDENYKKNKEKKD